MVVSESTKISEVIKLDERAIEVIATINSNFTKLRNPFLRKLLAPRVTIAQAAKIGNTTVRNILEKLQKLNFQVDFTEKGQANHPGVNQKDFISGRSLVEMDVREVLSKGKDPLHDIMESIKTLGTDQIFVIIAPFEPIPLIQILSRKGYQYFVNKIDPETVKTFFKKNDKYKSKILKEDNKESSETFLKAKDKFHNKFRVLDVRDMEMPEPMVAILTELSTLPEKMALLVHHKKEPLHLLVELQDKGYQYVVNKIKEHYVQVIIYK